MAYLLDANVFIEAKNRYYGFDVCAGFWDWLLASHEEGSVLSVENVESELVGGDDELARWARARGASFFKPVDEPALTSLAALSTWVRSGAYDPAAVATFLGAADFYVVGFAHAHGHVVVTQEVPAESVRKVKIPNACVGMGVRYLNTFEMLRRERARFVLAARSGAA